MNAIDFPASPFVNQIHIFHNRVWKFNGIGWVVEPNLDTAVLSVAKYNAVGPLVGAVGTSRWYPHKDVTIAGAYFSLGIPGMQTASLGIKKSGVSILGSANLICTAGEFKSNEVPLNVKLLTTDYITVDVLNASGADAVLFIMYL